MKIEKKVDEAKRVAATEQMSTKVWCNATKPLEMSKRRCFPNNSEKAEAKALEPGTGTGL